MKLGASAAAVLLALVTIVVGVSPTAAGGAVAARGYWAVESNGAVLPFGNAASFGLSGGALLNKPIVGIAVTPGAKGMWLVGADGGVFAVGGDARFYGSAAGMKLAAPIVGMTSTPDGRGYWLVGADGGVFAFGDAGFYGSGAGFRLNAPVVGIAATTSGNGYELAAADGGVFAFGDASCWCGGSGPLNAPVVGIVASPGPGYWLVAADGGVFAHGQHEPGPPAGANFFGSLGGTRLNAPIVAMAITADAHGYWLAGADGGVFSFGDAGFYGSAASPAFGPVARPVVGVAAAS